MRALHRRMAVAQAAAALATAAGTTAIAAPAPAPLMTLTLSAEGDVRAFVEAQTPVDLSLRKHLSAQGEGRFEGRLQGRLTFTRVAARFRDEPARLLTFGQLELPGGDTFYQITGWAIPLGGGRWRETGAVRFDDPPGAVAWLSETLGLWEGEFEAEGGQGSFRIHLPPGVTAPAAEPTTPRRASPLVYDDPSFVWQDNRDPHSPRRSPNATVGIQLGSTRLMVAYGRPALAGRSLVQSQGRLWRTGADEATTLTATDTVQIAGHELAAGTYSLFTVPGPESWTVVLNADRNQWGTAAYRKDRDILRFEVPARAALHQERLAFRFEEIDPDAASATLVLHWGETAVGFDVREP